MNHVHIIISKDAMEAIKNGQEVTHTLCLKGIEVHIRSSESFYCDEAKAQWVKNGRYIDPPKETIWEPWDELI